MAEGDRALGGYSYGGLFTLDADDPYDRGFWERVIAVRTAVGKHLEQARKAGAIGSSLDAEVDLYCDDALYGLLGRLGEELRFALITSEARLHAAGEGNDDAVATEVAGLRLVA